MEPFRPFSGVAAALPMINVDTDKIIPKQFLKTIARTGLGVHAFEELRYDEDGNPYPDFVLNQAPWNEAKILVSGDNFGCGSSREHAVWALKDFGFRCLIAPSFADIFSANCLKNGLLTVSLPESDVKRLSDLAASGLPQAVVAVDLAAAELRSADGEVFSFAIEPFRRRRLLEGLDDIALTLTRKDDIVAYEKRRAAESPWLAPPVSDAG